MKLPTWKGMAAIGLIAALLTIALGTVMVSADSNTQTAEDAPVVEVSDEAFDTLTVLVGAKIEGTIVPMAGVELEIFSVDISRENGTITIVLEKVAEGRTDQQGMAVFDLEHGKYLVIAHYNGLQAFGHCNLDEDMTMKMLLHNWERNFPVGADRIDKITIVLECA